MRLHHVQVACPTGGEDDARRFYRDGLGMTEVDKPADLRARGGAWFRAYDATGAVTAEILVIAAIIGLYVRFGIFSAWR